MTSTITRRSALTAGAAAGLVATPIPASAVAHSLQQHPDAELLALGEELRRAWAQERTAARGGSDEEAEAAFVAAYEASSAIVDQIADRVAHTREGLQVKAQAFLWCWSGDLDFELSREQTTDVRMAQSIIRDLIG